MTGSSAAARHTVVFQPSGVRGLVAEGVTIRRAAAELGVEIESICADAATCGKCRVVIEEGHVGGVESTLNHASRKDEAEADWISKRSRTWSEMGLDPRRLRLSCRAQVQGDLVVFVPESSRGNRQIIRKAATDRHIEVHPAVRRYYVEVEPAELHRPHSDLTRLAEALVDVMARVHTGSQPRVPAPGDLRFDLRLIRSVADLLREADGGVSVTVRQNFIVTDVRPGYHEQLCGVALDIGSTAIAAYLCDLQTGNLIGSDSVMNPQTSFGDDIMSRMRFEAEHEDGLATLHDALISGVNGLIERLLRSSGIPVEDVHEIAVVGNTTMHHHFLGLSTEHLGRAPFVPVVDRSLDLDAAALGVIAAPGANTHVLPIAASFVGADAMAVAIAEEPHAQDEILLIIDIGTNAELIAGNRDGLVCTSTPTGPAFEGAHIEYGMRAAEGALEHIEIDTETLEPRYRVVGVDGWGPHIADPADRGDGAGLVKGICGSAIVDGVAEMFRTGIITPRGHFAEGVASDRIRKGELGWEYIVAWADETSIGRDIPITLEDVRQIQLAKAALYTAARLLLRELGVEKPDKIILAGAFGSHIDTTRAMVLGMLPDCPLERVFSVGNAAGDGARIALLNRDKRIEAQRVARAIRRVELPTDPDFQNAYLQALNFPHMADRFDAVAHLIGDHDPDPMAERFNGPS